ncbi:MAG: hypothetical protein ACYTXC_24290 [Nostoc sp.]
MQFIVYAISGDIFLEEGIESGSFPTARSLELLQPEKLEFNLVPWV